MLIISETTDKLQIVLGSAVTTNELQCVVSYRDITTTDYTPARTVISTNGNTDVDLVGSPSASHQRVVDYISVYNADTVQALVTIKIDANGIEYVLHKDYLESGKTLYYIEGQGFFSAGVSNKQLKSIRFHGDAGANFTMTNAASTERFAGNNTRHLFMIDLSGYSQVRLITNVVVASALADSYFRVKYCVGWSTVVGNFLQLGSTQQVQVSVETTGHKDTGWIDLASGAKQEGITIGCTELGGNATADPALGATDILFR